MAALAQRVQQVGAQHAQHRLQYISYLFLFTRTHYAYMIADQSDHSLSIVEATIFTRKRHIPLVCCLPADRFQNSHRM